MTVPDRRLLRRAGLLLFAALLAGCVPVPPAKTASAESAPVAEEDPHEGSGPAYGGLYDDRTLAAYVDGIAQRLAATTDLGRGRRVRVAVLDSDIINALALPDGQIYVTRGLLALANDEAELAGVLAHEMAHIRADHAERQSVRENVGYALGGPRPGSSDRAATARRIQSGVMAYSRDQELEADRIGLEAMVRAGYDPQGMVDFLADMMRQAQLDEALAGGPANAGVPDFLLTHPRTEERIVQAESLAAASPSGDSDRDRFLAAIDGMRFGEGPGQALIRRSSVVDPGAGLRWDAPPDFALRRGDHQVYGLGAGESVLIYDRVAQRALPAADYLTRIWAKRVDLTGVESITVGNYPAATGIAQVETFEGPRDLRFVVVETGPDRIDRFVLSTRPELTAAQTPGMLRAVQSLRPLSAAERDGYPERRLVVVRVGSGDTVERLAARMAVDDAAVERFLVLNGLEPGAVLRPGSRVKLIVE